MYEGYWSGVLPLAPWTLVMLQQHDMVHVNAIRTLKVCAANGCRQHPLNASVCLAVSGVHALQHHDASAQADTPH